MKSPQLRLPVHARITVATMGTLLAIAAVVAGTLWFLARERSRLTAGSLPLPVDIPELDRKLLSDFAARVPR